MNETAATRILLVDDHEFVRRGLRALLEMQPGWKICGEAADGRSAVKMAAMLAPDIIVMDLSMPQLNGLEAARQMVAKAGRGKVIILSVHQTEEFVREALLAGACGYVLKSDAGGDLVNAVHAVLGGGTYFSSQVAAIVRESLIGGGPARALASKPLTMREREIVQLLAEGKLNRDVSDMLGISVKTVETHRARVMRKLGVKTVADLVRYAVRNGITTA